MGREGVGFLPRIFSGAKSIVMQISIVMLIFQLFSDQISGESLRERQTALRGRSPLEAPPEPLPQRLLSNILSESDNKISIKIDFTPPPPKKFLEQASTGDAVKKSSYQITQDRPI